MLVLDSSTGAKVASLHRAGDAVYGLDVIEGVNSALFSMSQFSRSPHICSFDAAAHTVQAQQPRTPSIGDVGLDRQVSAVVL